MSEGNTAKSIKSCNNTHKTQKKTQKNTREYTKNWVNSNNIHTLKTYINVTSICHIDDKSKVFHIQDYITCIL